MRSLVLPVLLLACGCSRAPADIEWRAPAMGTTYAVKTVGVPATVTRQLLQSEVDAILRRIDRQFSTYREDSEISRFNRSDSIDWWPVSEAVVTVVAMAERMSRLSDGAFDITAKPLVSLWGFGSVSGGARRPGTAEIELARRQTGYRKLEHRSRPPALRKQAANIQLDPNALVAGYAADLVAARLEQLGIRNYLVDMGGEYRLKGHNDRAGPWTIAIEEPLPDARRARHVLELTGGAVSTSGDYRDYFEAEGQRFSHVLDVRGGRPIRHNLTSVTVIAPTAMLADAWATTLLVLGEDVGYRLAARERVAALFMIRREQGLQEKITAGFPAHRVPREGAARKASPPPG